MAEWHFCFFYTNNTARSTRPYRCKMNNGPYMTLAPVESGPQSSGEGHDAVPLNAGRTKRRKKMKMKNTALFFFSRCFNVICLEISIAIQIHKGSRERDSSSHGSLAATGVTQTRPVLLSQYSMPFLILELLVYF